MRGVYQGPSRRRMRHRGSSPHARGLPVCRTVTACAAGIIPACAGFTPVGDVVDHDSRDHPRMRGVYGGSPAPGAPRAGSSPHARGLLRDRPRRAGELRIIPACAGFTSRWTGPPTRTWDHPRMRGVYGRYRSLSKDVRGSSPHARGLQEPHRREHRCPPDHPRMRGVYARSSTVMRAHWGSSPHARGLLQPAPFSPPGPGIIPACAGFTYDHRDDLYMEEGSSPHARGLRSPDRRVHRPRRIIPACAGFTARDDNLIDATIGSSPHARGLRAAVAVPDPGGRIIPACAGFTTVRTAAGRSHGDHPRMRGVYVRPAYGAQDSAGSSPHARGLRQERVNLLAHTGIIPACAGFTQYSAVSR